MAAQHLGVGAEQRLAELVDHARAAEVGKRIVRRARRDDGTVGQLVAGTVMVGDDHVEAELACAPHLVDGCDAAVDGEDEPAAFFGETLERAAADAVPLVEAAREMPLDLGAELAQDPQGQDGGADSVDVVVAVHADAFPAGDGGQDPCHGLCHVPQQEGIVQGLLAGQEGPRLVGVAVAAPHEHACRDLAEAELLREVARLPVRARTDSPDAL